MPSVHPAIRRFGGLFAATLVVAALVVVNTAAAPAQAACGSGAPVLQLANPNPGDVLPTGDLIISGVAFDPNASTGSGISRVDLFLGQRDSGGLFVGSVAPSQGAFQIKASLPNTANGGRDFVAYAYSSVNAQQTSVSVPVFIGAAPTPTPTGSSATAPAPRGETTQSTCAVSPAETSVAAFRPLPVPPLWAAPILQLANPSTGDVLSTGDVIIQGMAFDPAATQGAGIDRVELFLDSREDGGLLLGSGVPSGRLFSITAKLSNSLNGGHNLVAYARSSVTGEETIVSVPMFVGAAPTPTPRPTSH
jgi:hypothetical protein